MKSIGRINSTGSAHRALALQGPSAGDLGPHGIRLALLAALVLAGMALWPTPAPADGEEAGDLVWSADMTALEYASVSTGAAGADLFSNMGGSGNLQVKSPLVPLDSRARPGVLAGNRIARARNRIGKPKEEFTWHSTDRSMHLRRRTERRPLPSL